MENHSPQRQPDFEELRFLLPRMRKTRKWSLDELAERSGVARRSIVQIEAGKSHGSVATWFRLAEAFDVEIGTLLGALYGPTRTRDR